MHNHKTASVRQSWASFASPGSSRCHWIRRIRTSCGRSWPRSSRSFERRWCSPQALAGEIQRCTRFRLEWPILSKLVTCNTTKIRLDHRDHHSIHIERACQGWSSTCMRAILRLASAHPKFDQFFFSFYLSTLLSKTLWPGSVAHKVRAHKNCQSLNDPTDLTWQGQEQCGRLSG